MGGNDHLFPADSKTNLHSLGPGLRPPVMSLLAESSRHCGVQSSPRVVVSSEPAEERAEELECALSLGVASLSVDTKQDDADGLELYT